MKKIIILAALLLVSSLSASAEKYYMVMGNSLLNDMKRPVLSRYIYDTDNPTAVTPAPAKGLEGAAFVTASENSAGGLVFYAGKIYISCIKTGEIIRYNAYTGAREATIVKGLTFPAGLIVGPDKNLYVGCKDYIARFTLTGKPKPGLDNYGDVFSNAGSYKYGDGMAFDGKGNLLVCSQGSGEILEIEMATGEFKRTYARGQGVFSDLRIGPDKQAYVAATGLSGIDNKGFVGRIDKANNKLVPLKLENIKDPYGLTFTPDNKMIVTSYSDGIARLYDGDKYLGNLGSQAQYERDYRVIFYKLAK